MTKSSTSIVLLAAGASNRFGRPKQLIPFKGHSLLRHLAEVGLNSNASSVHIVLGAFADFLRHQLHGLKVESVVNPDWNSGISSSVRRGVQNLDRSVKAALIILCDQPYVTPQLLNKMIEAFEKTKKFIVACEYENSLGVPALFGRKLFGELENLSGDRGAKQVIMKYRNDVASIPFPEGSIDIDTTSDLPDTRQSF
jgi:molybdenum cofactor cytidylyltransferase